MGSGAVSPTRAVELARQVEQLCEQLGGHKVAELAYGHMRRQERRQLLLAAKHRQARLAPRKGP